MREPKFKIIDFKHTFEGEVKFSEVDSFNVVHNLSYLYWLEWARTDFLFEIGFPRTDEIFSENMPLMTVNSNVNYFKSLGFTDRYKVLTKVIKIGNSSIHFGNLIINKDRDIILDATTVLVYTDKNTGRPIDFPDNVRNLLEKGI